MTGLLEFREKLKLYYSKGEVFIIPIVKFLLALLVINVVNGTMGYMGRINSLPIVLIVSLMCSFLPNGAIVFFGALFALLHMYELSIEVAIVGAGVFLMVFLLFGRFSAKESLVVVITPIACAVGVPYVMPVAMGLLGSPVSGVSVGCGVLVFYLIQTVVNNATNINTMDEGESTAKIRLIIDGLMHNKAMLVMITAFVITVIVVYLIRRMSVEHSWTIAIIAGVIAELVILLVGDLLYDTNMSVLNALIGVFVTVLVAKVIEFFRFCVDYSRTEKVQFEDDEYYYYVKAIPKMTVAAQTKTVKRINTPTRPASGGAPVRRNVTTERTGYNGESGQRNKVPYNGSRSVTINGNMTSDDEDIEEYDDIF
jgi:hypothetical protein